MLRIAINLGDVMVEGSDLYGEGVNIAARLEAIAQPGSIVISGTAYDHIKSKVKVGFVDLGVQSLKNIAEPVRAYRVEDAPSVAIAAPKSGTDMPSIAVLPFANMSGDPGQEYFSDGITEDITTELSRFRSLSVIARHSSFAFKGKSVTVQQVGRELGVEFVLEGSVRRAGNRVRITAQLIDAQTSAHIWAERLDREMDDLFAMQDEVTERIVTTIATRLERTEQERAGRKQPEVVEVVAALERRQPGGPEDLVDPRAPDAGDHALVAQHPVQRPRALLGEEVAQRAAGRATPRARASRAPRPPRPGRPAGP